MDINKWLIFDTGILIVQFFLIAKFFISQKKVLNTFLSLILSLSAWLLITPLGLFPVGLLPIGDFYDRLVRNKFWHFKIVLGFSFNDLLLIFILFLLIFLKKKDLLKKQLLFQFYIICIVFLIGLFSIRFNVNTPDFGNLLPVLRTFLLLFIALFASHDLGSNNISNWISVYFRLLLNLIVLSVISMATLDTNYRAVRYWTHAVLQSQTSQIILLLFFIFSLSGKIKGKRAILFLLIGFLPALAGYKFSILIIIIFLFYAGFSKVIPLFNYFSFGKFLVFIIILCLLIFPALIVIYFTKNITEMDAMGTRFYQLINVLENLKNNGFQSIFFGIGWNQWYSIYYNFPFVDQGAWTIEQLYSIQRKFSVQLIPFSLLRSVGIIGLIVWIFFLFSLSFKAYKNLYKHTNSVFISISVLILLIQDLLSIPDVLPESILISTILFFSASNITIKEVNKSDT